MAYGVCMKYFSFFRSLKTTSRTQESGKTGDTGRAALAKNGMHAVRDKSTEL